MNPTDLQMTPTAWATLIVICGTVWGGFVLLLVRALRSEGQKSGGGQKSSEGQAARSEGRPG